MEERNYTVYMHVNKENEKTYIGITRMKIETRWGKDGNGYKDQLFGRAINKYGWDNFEHIILFENKTKEQAEELEILFIKVLLSNNRIYGYNIENGGNTTGKMTEETRKKLSESHKGMKAWNKGLISLIRGGKHPQAKKVICDGKIFDCAKDCADFYNVNYKQMNSWLIGKVNMPQDFFNKELNYIDNNFEIKPRISYARGNSKISKMVICDGKIFDCTQDCADYYNINRGTMSDWLRGNHSMPIEFFNMKLSYLSGNIKTYPNLDGKGCKKKVTCEGKSFESIVECANYYNVDSHNMSDWLAGRLNMRNDFYEKGLKFLYEDNKNIQPQNEKYRCKKVVCDNQNFDSITDCAKYYNINVNTMNCWLVCQNPMPQKFINLGLRYLDDNETIYKSQTKTRKREVVCNGKVFKTIKECSTFYNIKYSTMTSWLKGQNPMPREFKDLGLSYYIEEEDLAS